MVVRRVRPGALPQHLLERRWPSVLLQEIAERFLTDLVFGREVGIDSFLVLVPAIEVLHHSTIDNTP
jgi:hypothetical protein